MNNKVGIIYTTIDTEEKATNLAKHALTDKVATCVNIIPQGKSIYIWDHQISEGEEWYLIFKTSPEALDRLENWLHEHHPYDVSAILKLTVDSSEAFASYISAHVDTNKSVHNRQTNKS